MKIQFNKYEGTGNDFVIIDNRDGLIAHSDARLITRLCDRRFGIGADGLILVENFDGADFRMVYFNSDGLEASMCGNGGRCASHFAMMNITGFRKVIFAAADGLHTALPAGEAIIDLTIGDVSSISEASHGILVNTGVPHLVIFTDNTEIADFVSFARPIRYNSAYAPAGVNVNLVCCDDKGLKVRTYERGVEDETLSCGTGVTASAIAAAATGKIVTSETAVRVRGGELRVTFRLLPDGATGIHLIGPATLVFKGETVI